MANNEQIRIEITGLPGIYPDGYTDKIYLDKTRAVKTGIYSEEFVTSEKYTTTQDLNYKKLDIQKSFFDQYKIEIIRKESQSFQLLKGAQNVKIIDTSQSITYYANIIDVLIEDIFNSNFQKVTIEFYDSNEDNYIGVQPIADYLKSDVVYRLYGTGGCNKLSIYGNATVELYSIINGVLITKDAENLKTEELNGKNINTRATVKKAIQSIFYFGATDAQKVKENIIVGGIGGLIVINDNSNGYQSEELPEWTLEQISGSVDLWKLEIVLVYEINDVTPYN